jgi:integrase
VKVRVTHKREVAYIATPFFVVKSEMNRNYEIVDNIIQTQVTNHVNSMRKALTELGVYEDTYTAKGLAEYLDKCSRRGIKDKSADFIAFMFEYVNSLKQSGRSGAHKNYAVALRRLKEYAGETMPFENVTPAFLERFEKYLSGGGTGQRGISLYMSCYRKVFNEAKAKLNDDDRGVVVVKNYPFAKYKVPAIPESKEKAAGLDIVKHLYNYTPKGIEAELAKDMFFLSFYLIGINAVDIYSLKSEIKNGRITYQRSKTRGKRQDNAEISVRIEPEALAIISKYRDEKGERLFNLHRRYKSIQNFNKALSNGFIDIRKDLGVENLTFYSARHSWASIASNDCDISDSKIARCLNHVNMNHRVTSKYIKKDWSIIDNANRTVIDFVNSHLDKTTSF